MGVPDWVCYLDDDFIVNISVLKKDLLKMSEECSPNCIVADAMNDNGHGLRTSGGWCMERALYKRVANVLSQHTDEELGWLGPDDGAEDDGEGRRGFMGMLYLWLHVIPMDSAVWYSQNSRPA